MPQVIEFRVDVQNALRSLQAAPNEIRKTVRKELTAIAAETVKDVRSQLPEGLADSAMGYTWGFYGTKGFVMEAQGLDKGKSPKSWAAATEGSGSGTQGFRHPVYPAKGEPRNKWNWGPKGKGAVQAPLRLLQKAWDKHKVAAIQRADIAVKAGLRAAGLSD